MKTRTASIKTSNLGIIAIQEYCAKTNLIFQGEPREDYGVDCYIEIELETGPSNFLIGVQCRSGPSYRHDCADGSFVIYVSTDDVAYWLAANIPVLFVYYDVNERLLYWHHVQAAAEFFRSVNEIKHLSFNSMDSVQNKPLGEYARRLVYVTPTVTDRMAIFSAEMNCVVNGQLFPIRSSIYPVRTELVEKELLSYSTVIGYSLDDRWILIQELVDCGGIAPEIYVVMLDTREWAALRLPLAVHPESVPEFDDLQMSPDLVEEAQKAINKVEFWAPQRMLLRYDFVHQAPIAPTPNVAFMFGAERFDIEVEGPKEHRSLVLVNSRFIPPRRAMVLASATVPMQYISNDFSSIGEAQHLVGVCELVVSPSGKRVSIGAITNMDHICWGAARIFHVHLTCDALRRTCSEALLT